MSEWDAPRREGGVVFEIQPGTRVGSFEIGMPLPAAIRVIQREGMSLRQAKIAYNPEDVSAEDIVITLAEHSIRLRFETSSQRLCMIDVMEPSKVVLSYGGREMRQSPVRFSHVYDVIGLTYEGSFCPVRRIYSLFYPNGFAALFKLDENYVHQPNVRPDFSQVDSPVLDRVMVFHGPDPTQLALGPIPDEDDYYQRMEVTMNEGLYFPKYDDWLRFGDTVQEILSTLGRPDRVFAKPVSDVMRVHSQKPTSDLCHDYFFNYFTLGLDILFDGVSHEVKKFVLHTNLIGRPDFNQYHKCNFSLDRGDNAELFSPQSSGGDSDADWAPSSDLLPTYINAETKWSDIQQMLGTPSSRPLVRREDAQYFKPSELFAYNGVIFEIFEQHIARVVLFSATSAASVAERRAVAHQTPSRTPSRGLMHPANHPHAHQSLSHPGDINTSFALPPQRQQRKHAKASPRSSASWASGGRSVQISERSASSDSSEISPPSPVVAGDGGGAVQTSSFLGHSTHNTTANTSSKAESDRPLVSSSVSDSSPNALPSRDSSRRASSSMNSAAPRAVRRTDATPSRAPASASTTSSRALQGTDTAPSANTARKPPQFVPTDADAFSPSVRSAHTPSSSSSVARTLSNSSSSNIATTNSGSRKSTSSSKPLRKPLQTRQPSRSNRVPSSASSRASRVHPTSSPSTAPTMSASPAPSSASTPLPPSSANTAASSSGSGSGSSGTMLSALSHRRKRS